MPWGVKERVELAEMARGEKIVFWDVGIGIDGVADVLRVNSTVTELFLSSKDNSIGTDGACVLADALRVNSTVKLLLIMGAIGADGARAVADALRGNSTLTIVVVVRGARSESESESARVRGKNMKIGGRFLLPEGRTTCNSRNGLPPSAPPLLPLNSPSFLGPDGGARLVLERVDPGMA
jgi:hypothetical protein